MVTTVVTRNTQTNSQINKNDNNMNLAIYSIEIKFILVVYYVFKIYSDNLEICSKCQFLSILEGLLLVVDLSLESPLHYSILHIAQIKEQLSRKLNHN